MTSKPKHVEGESVQQSGASPEGRNLSEEDREHLDTLVALWREEISTIAELRFDSLEQALDHIIDAVVRRIDPEGSEADTIRLYLRAILDTDPGIKEELAQLVNLRG